MTNYEQEQLRRIVAAFEGMEKTYAEMAKAVIEANNQSVKTGKLIAERTQAEINNIQTKQLLAGDEFLEALMAVKKATKK